MEKENSREGDFKELLTIVPEDSIRERMWVEFGQQDNRDYMPYRSGVGDDKYRQY